MGFHIKHHESGPPDLGTYSVCEDQASLVLHEKSASRCLTDCSHPAANISSTKFGSIYVLTMGSSGCWKDMLSGRAGKDSWPPQSRLENLPITSPDSLSQSAYVSGNHSNSVWLPEFKSPFPALLPFAVSSHPMFKYRADGL